MNFNPSKNIFWKKGTILATIAKLVKKRNARDICLRQIKKQGEIIEKHTNGLKRARELLESNKFKHNPLVQEVEALEALLSKKNKSDKDLYFLLLLFFFLDCAVTMASLAMSSLSTEYLRIRAI